MGIDGDYSRFSVAPGDLGEVIRALSKLGLAGVNVTVPHKVAVMAHLNHFDPTATTINAVNTIIVDPDGSMKGHNTDFVGVIEPVQAFYESGERGGLARVLGAGGAGRAAVMALTSIGFETLVLNRNAERARALTVEAGGAYWDDRNIYDLTENRRLTLHGSERLIIVNATTCGMIGFPALEVELEQVDDATVVYDMVYSPLETPLLVAAKARGLRTIDGLQMLVAQAAAAFVLFYGHPAPREHDAELRALLTA
jgi:shikimate dehydrogenase